jgi:NAD(P)H-flavin reductase
MTKDPGWQEETRKVGAQFIEEYLGGELDSSRFLVAGPPAMAESVQSALGQAGVKDENVVTERYSGY